MKAAYYERVGKAREVLRVGAVARSEPAPGELGVRVLWSGVNPSDVKSRSGRSTRPLAYARQIPHSDGMGIVEAVGENVDRKRVGERVWLWNAAWGRDAGTAAEFICVPQHMAVPLPDGVEGAIGACLGIPAMTAMHAVLMDGGISGKTVLISGGAGAVGHYAIQFASLLGAKQVLTTVSGEQKAQLARAAGADTVFNYKTEPVAELIRETTLGAGVDRVIELDLGTNAPLALEVLRAGGECVAYGSTPTTLSLPFPLLLTKSIQLKFFLAYSLSSPDRTRAQAVLGRMLARGQLQHNVAARLPLERIVDAHEMVEQGRAVGNVVLSVADEPECGER